MDAALSGNDPAFGGMSPVTFGERAEPGPYRVPDEDGGMCEKKYERRLIGVGLSDPAAAGWGPITCG